MDEEKARAILGDTIDEEGGLYNPTEYTSWQKGSETICLDANYTIEQLEAIVWWMKNKK